MTRPTQDPPEPSSRLPADAASAAREFGLLLEQRLLLIPLLREEIERLRRRVEDLERLGGGELITIREAAERFGRTAGSISYLARSRPELRERGIVVTGARCLRIHPRLWMEWELEESRKQIDASEPERPVRRGKPAPRRGRKRRPLATIKPIKLARGH